SEKFQSGFLLFTDRRTLGELGQARDIHAITPPHRGRGCRLLLICYGYEREHSQSITRNGEEHCFRIKSSQKSWASSWHHRKWPASEGRRAKRKGKERRARKSKIRKLTVAQHHFSAFQNGADDLLCVLSWISSRSCGRFRGGRSRAEKNWQIPSVTGLD